MAYHQDYERQHGLSGNDRINYSGLQQSSMSTRGILIAFGIIAAGVAAMLMFADLEVTGVDPSLTGQATQQSAPTQPLTAPLAPLPAPTQ